MKNNKNLIGKNEQNTKDVIGYFFEGADCNQMTFWKFYADKTSEVHAHEFDDYLVCVYGKYTVTISGKDSALNPGDEFLIQKGTAPG